MSDDRNEQFKRAQEAADAARTRVSGYTAEQRQELYRELTTLREENERLKIEGKTFTDWCLLAVENEKLRVILTEIHAAGRIHTTVYRYDKKGYMRYGPCRCPHCLAYDKLDAMLKGEK